MALGYDPVLVHEFGLFNSISVVSFQIFRNVQIDTLIGHIFKEF